MSKMDELIGLFIEDEAANVDVYTRLFALEGLKLDCLDKLPLTVDSYYDIILEKNVDFLIIDFHLEKQVTYKGINDKRIENSLVFEEYNMDFKMKFNGSTYYCELLVDNSLEEKTEYRKNISVEKLTTWFEKLNSNFGILFYYPRINRMYFYPVSNNMTLPEITDGKKIRQIKINDKCLL